MSGPWTKLGKMRGNGAGHLRTLYGYKGVCMNCRYAYVRELQGLYYDLYEVVRELIKNLGIEGIFHCPF